MSDQTQVRIRLSNALATKLLALSPDERAKVVAAALEGAPLTVAVTQSIADYMGTWSPPTLSSIAAVLEAVADGRLKWTTGALHEGEPYYVLPVHHLEGWARLLREAHHESQKRWNQ